MKDRLRRAREHIEAALERLPSDEDVDRLVNPRHTDHDRHVFLPTKVSRGFAAAQEALQAAIDELSHTEQTS